MGVMAHARRFDHVSVGMCFEHGGNLWRKRSQRTARIVASIETVENPGTVHRRYKGTWCYWRNAEAVNADVRRWIPHT